MWLQNHQELVAGIGAALIGIAAALVTNWVQSATKKSQNSQDWFEQHYVFEGVDVLIRELSHLSYFYSNVRLKLKPPSEDLKIPIDALERVQVLLNGGVFRADVTDFRDAIKYLYVKLQVLDSDDFGNARMVDWLNSAEELLTRLTDLRTRLLELQIKKKGEVYNIYKDAKVIAVSQHLTTEAKKVQKLAEVSILKRFPPYDTL